MNETEVMNEDIRHLIELQVCGARGSSINMGHKGGAGPTGAKAFLFGGKVLMIPTLNEAARHSGYRFDTQGEWIVFRKGQRDLLRATDVAEAKFYSLSTADGISYRQIARLHGKDCLASTVIQECVHYDDMRTRCHFCSIGESAKNGETILRKTPEQLVEVALAAKRLDHVTHVTLTSGSTDPVSDAAIYLGKCARAIKEASGLPIQVQLEPLDDPRLYRWLKDQGVDHLALHLESFDPKVRRQRTPGKALLTVEDYFDAFTEAVSVFGRGRVSTYVILGLGESEERTLSGCKRAIELGVYPFVVPLRPADSTFLSRARPPQGDYLYRVYSYVARVLSAYGMRSDDCAAGCAKCKACSMLQFFEEEGSDE